MNLIPAKIQIPLIDEKFTIREVVAAFRKKFVHNGKI